MRNNLFCVRITFTQNYSSGVSGSPKKNRDQVLFREEREGLWFIIQKQAKYTDRDTRREGKRERQSTEKPDSLLCYIRNTHNTTPLRHKYCFESCNGRDVIAGHEEGRQEEREGKRGKLGGRQGVRKKALSFISLEVRRWTTSWMGCPASLVSSSFSDKVYPVTASTTERVFFLSESASDCPYYYMAYLY